eukprot:206886-Pelagomonas_calceolata.AAC.2
MEGRLARYEHHLAAAQGGTAGGDCEGQRWEQYKAKTMLERSESGVSRPEAALPRALGYNTNGEGQKCPTNATGLLRSPTWRCCALKPK